MRARTRACALLCSLVLSCALLCSTACLLLVLSCALELVNQHEQARACAAHIARHLIAIPPAFSSLPLPPPPLPPPPFSCCSSFLGDSRRRVARSVSLPPSLTPPSFPPSLSLHPSIPHTSVRPCLPACLAYLSLTHITRTHVHTRAHTHTHTCR